MNSFFRGGGLLALWLLSAMLLASAQVSKPDTVGKLEEIARKNILDNRSNFADGTDFFRAAPGYPDVYLSDLGLTMTGLPDEFSAIQVKNIIDKFLARTNGSGWVPMALRKDGSLYVYCSAWDLRCAHPTGDGAFFSAVAGGTLLAEDRFNLTIRSGCVEDQSLIRWHPPGSRNRLRGGRTRR